MYSETIGWCNYHEVEVTLGYFEYKGCWNCFHFTKNNNDLLYVEEVAEELGCSKKTVYRYLRDEKIEALRCERTSHVTGLRDGFPRLRLGSHTRWLIPRESVETLRALIKKRHKQGDQR